MKKPPTMTARPITAMSHSLNHTRIERKTVRSARDKTEEADKRRREERRREEIRRGKRRDQEIRQGRDLRHG